MSGMPVDRKAVERSPQGIVIASRGPPGNGISRVFHPTGTGTSSPPTRARPPLGIPSSIVFIVPAELLKPLNASRSLAAPGSAWASEAARQSDGTTSNPTPGRTTRPARTASSPRANSDSKTSISPVMSRYAVPAARQASNAARFR